jgi:hypothetical protein
MANSKVEADCGSCCLQTLIHAMQEGAVPHGLLMFEFHAGAAKL